MNVTHPALQNTTFVSTNKIAPVWRVAAIATAAAAIVTEIVATVGRAFGASLEAGSIGAKTSERIPIGGFASATLMCGAVGVLIALAFARWAKRPDRNYYVVALALTALSFVPSLTAGHTTGGTKLTLCLGHLVAAAIIIPVVSARLSRVDRPSVQ
jgi:O-antigen ligase